jgi:hypothetical protein
VVPPLPLVVPPLLFELDEELVDGVPLAEVPFELPPELLLFEPLFEELAVFDEELPFFLSSPPQAMASVPPATSSTQVAVFMCRNPLQAVLHSDRVCLPQAGPACA